MIKNHESSKTLLVLFGDKSVGKSRTLFNLVIKLAGGDSIILKKELEKAGFLRNGKVIKVWTIRDRE